MHCVSGYSCLFLVALRGDRAAASLHFAFAFSSASARPPLPVSVRAAVMVAVGRASARLGSAMLGCPTRRERASATMQVERRGDQCTGAGAVRRVESRTVAQALHQDALAACGSARAQRWSHLQPASRPNRIDWQRMIAAALAARRRIRLTRVLHHVATAARHLLLSTHRHPRPP